MPRWTLRSPAAIVPLQWEAGKDYCFVHKLFSLVTQNSVKMMSLALLTTAEIPAMIFLEAKPFNMISGESLLALFADGWDGTKCVGM
jgi:hypothetical protein